MDDQTEETFFLEEEEEQEEEVGGWSPVEIFLDKLKFPRALIIKQSINIRLHTMSFGLFKLHLV